MGKRGPAPAPRAMKLVKGERSDRLNDAEPVPQAGPVSPPGWLSTEALRVWDEYAPQLEARGVLTPWDVDTFAILCDAIVHYRQASALVAASGVLIKGRKDAAVKSPAMQVVRDTAATVRVYAAEFGMTPSSRGALVVNEDAQAGGAGRLLT